MAPPASFHIGVATLVVGLSCWLAPPVTAQESITLFQAVARAQTAGNQAQAIEATRDAARYRDRAFYSRQLPQLSLSATAPAYNRSIIPVVQPDGSTSFRTQNQTNIATTATLSQPLALTGGDFFVTSSLSRLSVSGTQSFRTYSSTPVSFGLRQPIFRPNTVGWDRKEQPVRLELAERQYLEGREDIAVQTVGLFFDVYAARTTLRNAQTNAAVNDTLYTLNNGRYQVGRIGENDLLQSELALLRARSAVDAAQLEYERALAALRIAMGVPPATPIEILIPDHIPTFDPDTARAVIHALNNRASVAQADLQDVQARRRVTEAKLNTGFGATLQASYGFNTTTSEFDQAYKNLLEARQVTVAVEIPIWQWGAHNEGVQAAQADQRQVESSARGVRDQVAQEAHFAALQLSQARRNLAIVAKADTVADKRFEVAYNRYLIGRITIDNLFIAQNEKDQAVAQLVQALRGYWQSYYQLRRLTLFDFESGTPIR